MKNILIITVITFGFSSLGICGHHEAKEVVKKTEQTTKDIAEKTAKDEVDQDNKELKNKLEAMTEKARAKTENKEKLKK